MSAPICPPQGVFLFIFTSAIPWRLEEMASEQSYVVQFFSYAAGFVVVGLVRDPTTWTVLQKDGPNHLGSR